MKANLHATTGKCLSNMISDDKITNHPNFSKYFDGFAATLSGKKRLYYLSQVPCLACQEKGLQTAADIHHLKHDLDGQHIGVSVRNSDLMTIPICKWHHQISFKVDDPSVHNSPKAFAEKWSVDGRLATAELDLLWLTNQFLNIIYSKSLS